MTEQEYKDKAKQLIKIKIYATAHKNHKRAKQADSDYNELMVEYKLQLDKQKEPVKFIPPNIILP